MTARPAPRRVALVDRDGTIIVDKVYLADPAGIEFAPGAIEGLATLRDAGFELILVTNQSGIARGYFSIETLDAIHRRLRELLANHGIDFKRIYYCPHAPADDCGCRKPAPGMIRQAMADYGFMPSECVMIGDSDADMGAATACGIKGLQIRPSGDRAGSVTDFRAAARAAVAHFSHPEQLEQS